MSLEVLWRDESEIGVLVEGAIRRFNYVMQGDTLLLTDGYGYWTIPITSGEAGLRARQSQIAKRVAGTESRPTSTSGKVISQMPGKVLEVRHAAGDSIQAGDVLLVLEAMKMEHAIAAPCAGVVKLLTLTVGARVMPGDVLAEIEPA